MTAREIKEKVEIALRYASLGWRVVISNWPLPNGECSCHRPHCTAIGKHPRLTDWVTKATTDEEIIRAWFDQWPHANVSIVTGRESGIFALDIDNAEDPEKSGITSIQRLVERHGGLPQTPTFFTGSGGFHHLFKYPGRHVPTRARLAPGIDIRGDGGQIVAPPSRNAKGLYEIDPDPTFGLSCPVPDAPEWLLALVSSAEDSDRTDRDQVRFDMAAALEGSPEGERDEKMFKLACKMRDLDIPKEMAIDWVRRAASRCTPSFPEKSAEEKVERAYKKYQPRTKWDPNVFERRDQQIGAPRNREWVKPFLLENPSTKTLGPNLFPHWLERFIDACGESYQVPREMVATVALSAISAAVAKKGIIRIKRDWSEKLNLYTIVAMPPSGRKSPVYLAATKPLYEYQKSIIEMSREHVAMLTVERDMKKHERAQKIRQYTKVSDEERGALMREVAKIELRLMELDHIDVPRLIVDDTTPEALASLLYRNNERIAVMSADGAGVFKQMCGKYTGIADADIYVKGWSGDTKIVDRVGRSSEIIHSPAITLSLAVQPKVMRGLTAMAAADQGLFARFLYCFPVDNIGQRDIDSADVPYEITASYDDKLTKMLNLPLPAEQLDTSGRIYSDMNVLCFNEDGRQHMLDFERELEKQRGKTVDESLRQWLGKHGGNTARIIGLLHLADNIDIVDETGGSPWEIPITDETVDRGIAIGQFFIDHAIAAFDEMEADPIKNEAIHVLTWIQKYDKKGFFKNEAIHAMGRTGDKASLVLTYLTDRGYIRTKDPKDDPRRSGNGEYEVNPYVHTKDYHVSDSLDPQ